MIKKAVIVEFVGLAGSGKTTTSIEVINSLIKKGISCPSRKDIKDCMLLVSKQYYDLSVLDKIKYYFENFTYYKGIIFRALIFSFSIALTNPTKAFKVFRKIILRYTFLLKLIEKFSKKEVVIIDEGMIHSCWSFIVPESIPSHYVIKKLLMKMFKQYYPFLVWCDIDVETATYRVINRNSENSRFDNKLTYIEAKQLLSKYNTAVDKLIMNSPQYNSLDYLKLNGTDPVEKKSIFLVNFLVRFLQKAKSDHFWSSL